MDSCTIHWTACIPPTNGTRGCLTTYHGRFGRTPVTTHCSSSKRPSNSMSRSQTIGSKFPKQTWWKQEVANCYGSLAKALASIHPEPLPLMINPTQRHVLNLLKALGMHDIKTKNTLSSAIGPARSWWSWISTVLRWRRSTAWWLHSKSIYWSCSQGWGPQMLKSLLLHRMFLLNSTSTLGHWKRTMSLWGMSYRWIDEILRYVLGPVSSFWLLCFFLWVETHPT